MPVSDCTMTVPEAPVPTIAATIESLSTWKLAAAMPPNLTALTVLRFFPLISTLVPVVPDLGENAKISGRPVCCCWTKVKCPMVSSPAGLFT